MKNYFFQQSFCQSREARPLNVMALEVGRNSPYDYRIKSVVYNPVNVVKIDAIAGVATHIVVAPDETYITHAFGDSESWTFAHKMNHFL